MPAQPLVKPFTVGNLDFQILWDVSDPKAHPTVSIPAPKGFRVLGGGAQVEWSPGKGPGALLTAMYPALPTDDDNTSGIGWTVASKDHEVSYVHRIFGY